MLGLHAVALQTACSIGELYIEFISRTQDLKLIILEFWFCTQQGTSLHPPPLPLGGNQWIQNDSGFFSSCSINSAINRGRFRRGSGSPPVCPPRYLPPLLHHCFHPPTYTPSPPSPAESSLINILHLPNELCQLELCAWLPACLVTFFRVECVWWGTWTWAQLPAFKCVPWSHASPISHITVFVQLIA